MKKLDEYSYQCGVIDAFNEVVRAGVKRIALSHPVDTKEEAMRREYAIKRLRRGEKLRLIEARGLSAGRNGKI